MHKIKIKSLRIYDAIEVNRAKETFLVSADYAPPEGGFNKKYRNLELSYYPELHVVEIKDLETKFHSLVPSTNVAEMHMIPEHWDEVMVEDKVESKPKSVSKSKKAV